jgi:Protein of unknown function (DUF2844)
MGLRRAGSLLLLGLAMNVLCVRTVCAGLGGDAASVLADSNQMQGVLHSYSSPQFDVQEITTENGIRVREFVNRDGLVFAIAWSGPAEPDLQQLLRVHFAQYHQARMAQTPPGLHRALRLALPDLVIESGGHMRAYRGRAYLPMNVPAGASTADLK